MVQFFKTTSHWRGRVGFDQATIERFAPFNAWYLERKFEQIGPQTVALNTITTGNFSGCDVWLSQGRAGRLAIDTPLVQAQLALADLGMEEQRFDAGGLERCMRVMRLPERLETKGLTRSLKIPLQAKGDNPIWLRVETEDGFVAWSSPIYAIDDDT